jgi:hypothetical protein
LCLSECLSWSVSVSCVECGVDSHNLYVYISDWMLIIIIIIMLTIAPQEGN